MQMRVILGVAAATLALVTACSSSKSSNTSAGSGASGGGVTISASSGVLTGPDGHALYANTVDTVAKISCTGTCAKEWPPVTGSPVAGAGVDAAQLGTATRPDGAKQVTYDGHPLYEFAQDMSAGDRKGEGIADQGGSWHVAMVSGGVPTSGPSSTSGSGSSTSGGGYGY
jgi:predicted lipoprotein with Yx(FWY)xxD motif